MFFSILTNCLQKGDSHLQPSCDVTPLALGCSQNCVGDSVLKLPFPTKVIWCKTWFIFPAFPEVTVWWVSELCMTGRRTKQIIRDSSYFRFRRPADTDQDFNFNSSTALASDHLRPGNESLFLTFWS